MSSVETEPPPPPASPKGRRRSALFIGAFIALQFLVPLTYLTRDDPTDERFTWRLSSDTRTPACEASAEAESYDGARHPVAIETLVHDDWVRHVERDRKTVIDAFLRKQCESADVLEVTLTNRCDDDRGVREYSLRCGGERTHETQRQAAR